MSSDGEQIGALYFVPNADYPYPFPVEPPPRFWMEEQTGKLAEAVEVYMRSEPLSRDQLALLHTYLKQYLERAVMTGDAPRARLVQEVPTLKKPTDFEQFVEKIAEWGIEPF